jgi:TonB family protein
MAPALVLAAALASPGPTPAPAARPRCEWSEAFARLEFPGFAPGAALVPPRRTKGRVRWPNPRQRHVIQGRLVAQVAIDARGRTIDARIVERPAITPPWPELEQSVLKDVRKLRWAPATADGVAVPVCLDLPVFETPRRPEVP